VRILCDRVLVLRRGEAVETGPCAEVFAAPKHPYTRMLLDSIPLPEIEPGWLDRVPAQAL
jgi:ABC-type dipeptide/oligopeptide/nickel transport system ATPase component